MYYGLQLPDLFVLFGYFLIVAAIGVIASRLIRNREDFIMGGRRFGKVMTTMFTFASVTHAEQAVDRLLGVRARGEGEHGRHDLAEAPAPHDEILAVANQPRCDHADGGDDEEIAEEDEQVGELEAVVHGCLESGVRSQESGVRSQGSGVRG